MRYCQFWGVMIILIMHSLETITENVFSFINNDWPYQHLGNTYIHRMSPAKATNENMQRNVILVYPFFYLTIYDFEKGSRVCCKLRCSLDVCNVKVRTYVAQYSVPGLLKVCRICLPCTCVRPNTISTYMERLKPHCN